MALKTETRKVQEPPFRGQSVVNSKKRTFNWPFFYALVNSVGVPVPNIMEELRKDQNKDTRPVQDTSEDGKEILKVEDRGKEKLSTSSSDSDVEEVLVYTGNEDGIPMQDFEEYDGMEDVDNDSSGDDASEAEDFSDDEIVDEEEAHIENLVALSGNSSKCYDTERWFRTLLWTLHMYIDGYCCDYTFQYGKPYGPSCEVICRYISDHNGDPFLLHAPVSNAAPLLPHQAAMAMLPRHASHLLPGPLRLLLEDPVVAKRMFPSNDVVRLPEMLRSIEKIPPTAYASEERKRTVHARPFLLRRPREHDFIPKVNPSIGKPGPKFPNLPQYPTILRKFIIATQAPPCYPWPAGSIQNMLQLPYKVVGGTPLKRPPRKDRTIMGKRLGPNISRAVTGPSRSKQSPLTDGRIGKKVQTQQDAPLKNSVS